MEKSSALAPLVLDVPASAKHLGGTKRSVYTLIRRGELAAKRIGHRYVISLVELERWANSGNREGQPRNRGAR